MQTHPNWGMGTFTSGFLVLGPLGHESPWPFRAGALRQVEEMGGCQMQGPGCSCRSTRVGRDAGQATSSVCYFSEEVHGKIHTAKASLDRGSFG